LNRRFVHLHREAKRRGCKCLECSHEVRTTRDSERRYNTNTPFVRGSGARKAPDPKREREIPNGDTRNPGLIFSDFLWIRIRFSNTPSSPQNPGGISEAPKQVQGCVLNLLFKYVFSYNMRSRTQPCSCLSRYHHTLTSHAKQGEVTRFLTGSLLKAPDPNVRFKYSMLFL